MITKIPELNKGNIAPIEQILEECQEAFASRECVDNCSQKTYFIPRYLSFLKQAPNKFLRYIGVN